MTHEAVLRALGSCDLFGELEHAELDRLARASRVRRYDKDEVVFARGDPGGTMFLIGQGSVALSVASADGGQVVLAVLTAPQTFGELAVIDGGARVATATARQPSLLVVIPQAEVLRLLRDKPALGVALLSALTAMIRRIDEQASDLVLLDLRSRVAKFLLASAASQRRGTSAPQAGLVQVDIRLTQTELARLVGGSRQQVNRVIVAMEAAGAVQRRGSRIVGVRPGMLDGAG